MRFPWHSGAGGEPSMSFGRLIRARRRALDLTQEDLAHKVGYSVITIRKVEADERRPSRQLVQRLAQSLGIAPDQRATFAALGRPGDGEAGGEVDPPTNLPAPLTRLIGRETELAAVCGALTQREVRLVTLVGPPGIGKSRLALQVAADLRNAFPAGIFHVPLAAISDAALVPAIVAKSVGVREISGQSLTSTLIDHLHDRRALLVIDDFEHLLAAASLIADVLRACPAPKILATSRAPLRIRGEQLFPVPALAAAASIELFAERAEAVRPEFRLSAANLAQVAGICADLEGLPLAIELVAARTRLMTLQELAARLNDRLALLTDGPRDAPAHQQTLRNTIDWSYDLLSAAEQVLFARLAVFVGGCSLAAAEEVVSALGALPLTVLDGLAALADQNLLGYEDRADGQRYYQFLGMIREYAMERLVELGEPDEARSAWSGVYLRLAETANEHLGRDDQQLWLDRLDSAHDNLRATLDWYVHTEAAEPALRMVAALWTFWHVRSRQTEGRRVIGPVLALPSAPADRHRALALFGAGWIALDQSDHAQATAYFAESLAIFRELGDARGIADALHGVGIMAQASGDDAGAGALFSESLALNRQLQDEVGIAWSLDHLGNAALGEGDCVGAQKLFEESMSLFRKLGHDWGIAISLHHQGLALLEQGEFGNAHKRFSDGVPLFRKLSNDWGVAASFEHMGYVALSRREHTQAVESLIVSLSAYQAAKDRAGFARCLAGLASAAVAEGALERAAYLFAGAEATAEAGGIRMNPVARAIQIRDVAVVRSALSSWPIAKAWAAGAAATMGQLWAFAQSP
jgi:predicted ATPase/DNA-binding XRE family transcriptional regulator